jgi:hypothetical protein
MKRFKAHLLIGAVLLRLFSAFDLSAAQITSRLLVKGEWREKEFDDVRRFIAKNK